MRRRKKGTRLIALTVCISLLFGIIPGAGLTAAAGTSFTEEVAGAKQDGEMPEKIRELGQDGWNQVKRTVNQIRKWAQNSQDPDNAPDQASKQRKLSGEDVIVYEFGNENSVVNGAIDDMIQNVDRLLDYLASDEPVDVAEKWAQNRLDDLKDAVEGLADDIANNAKDNKLDSLKAIQNLISIMNAIMDLMGNLSPVGEEYAMLAKLLDFLNDLLNMLEQKLPPIDPWWAGVLDTFIFQVIVPPGNEPIYFVYRMAAEINCYKPNIYLYGEAGMRCTLVFPESELLTRTLPEYTDSWEVELAADGTLTVDGETGYPYLFYESRTIPGIFQRTEGFTVYAQDRAEQFEEILEAYGLNGQEIRDFIEFWDDMLDKDTDYRMYPQTTELVDAAMPIAIEGTVPDSYFRIWFCFQPADSAAPEPDLPEIRPASREGMTLIEWGGMIL